MCSFVCRDLRGCAFVVFFIFVCVSVCFRGLCVSSFVFVFVWTCVHVRVLVRVPARGAGVPVCMCVHVYSFVFLFEYHAFISICAM